MTKLRKATGIHLAPQPLIDQLEYISNPLTYARKTMKRIPELEKLPGAFDDLIHSLTFLTAYNGSGATFNSYRREIERLDWRPTSGSLHWP